MNLRSLFMAMTVVRISANRMTVSIAGMPPVLIHRARTNTIEVALHRVLERLRRRLAREHSSSQAAPSPEGVRIEPSPPV